MVSNFMNGPYCASLLDDVGGKLELRFLSGMADCIPIALRLPFTALNVYSVDEGPQNSGASEENSSGD